MSLAVLPAHDVGVESSLASHTICLEYVLQNYPVDGLPEQFLTFEKVVDIQQDHPLWTVLSKYVEHTDVEVRMDWDGSYVPWYGNQGDCGRFSAIRISPLHPAGS